MNFNKRAGIGALVATFLATIIIVILLIISIFSSGFIKKFERGDRLKAVSDENIILKDSIVYVERDHGDFLEKRFEFQKILYNEGGSG
jgi:hypothetical protein